MKASVKVMLSYDYCHFEVVLGTDDGDSLTIQGANELRKTAQRLADEAVRQYQEAKRLAQKRMNADLEAGAFLGEIKAIEAKPEGDRTVNEIAQMKVFQDDQWRAQFEYEYDYEDDPDWLR